jgi:hypothetical protein
MKIQKFITTGVMAASALMLTSSAQAVPNLTLDNFASGSGIGNFYGYDTPVYAAGVADPYNGNAGSAYFQNPWSGPNNSGSGGNISTAFVCYNGGNPWDDAGTIDFSQYIDVQFDIKWDTASTLTIDQFNTGTNWPASFLPVWAPNNYMATAGQWIAGVDLLIVDNPPWPPQTMTDLGSFLIPLNAGAGWQTVTIPIPISDSGAITSANGLIFKKWSGYSWAVAQAPPPTPYVSGNFWVDNIVLVGSTPAPNPTMLTPSQPTAGLNVWNWTEANTFYDRNEVMANSTSQLGFAGGDTFSTSGNVTYSFGLAGFPQNDPLGPEAYMFLVPNAINKDTAPDWNETNCMTLEVQSTANGSQAVLLYKTNLPGAEPGAPPYGYGTGVTVTFNGTTNTSVPSTKLLGTYSLVFTDANDGYVQVPDGTTGTFSLGSVGSTYFKEVSSTAYPFMVYWGGQANNAGGMNGAVVFSNMSVTGVPNGFTENFLTESVTSMVTNGPTYDAASVFIVPTTALWWVDWTEPATGFVLENAPTIKGPWSNTTTYAPLSGYGEVYQLVAPGDLTSPTKAQYFRVVKRIYTNILVALPGQTFVSGTGVTGTPTTLYASTNCAIFGPETATAYAVDANNVLCTGVNGDNVVLDCTTDSAGTADFVCDLTSSSYESVTMVNGEATFGAPAAFFWGYAGLCAPVQESVMVVDQQVNFTNTSSLVSLDVSP